MELVKEIKKIKPFVEIVNLTAFGTIQDGAFDYIIKGDDNDKIILLINKAIEKINIRLLNSDNKSTSSYIFDSIIDNLPQ